MWHWLRGRKIILTWHSTSSREPVISVSCAWPRSTDWRSTETGRYNPTIPSYHEATRPKLYGRRDDFDSTINGPFEIHVLDIERDHVVDASLREDTPCVTYLDTWTNLVRTCYSSFAKLLRDWGCSQYQPGDRSYRAHLSYGHSENCASSGWSQIRGSLKS